MHVEPREEGLESIDRGAFLSIFNFGTSVDCRRFEFKMFVYVQLRCHVLPIESYF
jgi:hypothetical protein